MDERAGPLLVEPSERVLARDALALQAGEDARRVAAVHLSRAIPAEGTRP